MRKGEAGKTEKRRKGKGGSEEGAAPGSGWNALHLPPALAFKFPTSDLSQPAPAASPRKSSRAARPRMLQPAMFSGPASRAAQLSFEAGARGQVEGDPEARLHLTRLLGGRGPREDAVLRSPPGASEPRSLPPLCFHSRRPHFTGLLPLNELLPPPPSLDFELL